eukprot:2926652-Ditylum_brightwellii.AAC.1
MGTVPIELGMVTKIQKLDISNNRLGWTNSEVLDLSQNKIDQDVSLALGGISSIKELLLSDNYFYSTILNVLRSLVHLERLHLDANHLFGTIPDDILSLVRLRELPVKGLCCNGNSGRPVCSDGSGVEIGTQHFCLTQALYGTIPAGFGNMPYMNVLEMPNNLLT